MANGGQSTTTTQAGKQWVCARYRKQGWCMRNTFVDEERNMHAFDKPMIVFTLGC